MIDGQWWAGHPNSYIQSWKFINGTVCFYFSTQVYFELTALTFKVLNNIVADKILNFFIIL